MGGADRFQGKDGNPDGAYCEILRSAQNDTKRDFCDTLQLVIILSLTQHEAQAAGE